MRVEQLRHCDIEVVTGFGTTLSDTLDSYNTTLAKYPGYDSTKLKEGEMDKTILWSYQNCYISSWLKRGVSWSKVKSVASCSKVSERSL